MYCPDEGSPSIYRVLDELIKRRWKHTMLPRKELDEVTNSVRRKAVECFFLFQRGPHKFVEGRYPEPSVSLFNKLLDVILARIAKCKGELFVTSLKQLIQSLDQDRHLNLLIFLLIVSQVQCYEAHHHRIHVPTKRELLNTLPDDNKVPTYSTFDSSTLATLPDENSEKQRLFDEKHHPFSILDSSQSTIASENLFMNFQNLDFENVQRKHFLGAFTSLGSEAKQALHQTGLAPLWIPMLNADSCETKLFSLGDVKSSKKSCDEDEGYSDTTCDRSRYPPPLTGAIAHRWVSALLEHTVEGVGDVLFSYFHPFTRSSTDIQPTTALYQNEKEILEGKRFSWIARGLGQATREPPFLSEAGTFGSAILCHIYQERFNIGSSQKAESVGLTQSDPVTQEPLTIQRIHKYRRDAFHDILLLRMGLQCDRFYWAVSEKAENIPANAPLSGHFIHYPCKMDALSLGVSDRALANLVADHLRAGTAFRRLDWFAHQVVPLTPTPGKAWQGPTWACFTHALAQWLTSYEEALQIVLKEEQDFCRGSTLNAGGTYGLLELNNRLKTLTDRISFVADLCMLKGASCPLLNYRGIELLVYLAVRADHFACTPSEPIARFLFKRTCGPFLNFLERLLLDGIWDACGTEFNLSASNTHLLCRDVTFWCGSFKFTASNARDKTTQGFLKLLPAEFEEHVLRCAKSIHLLKLIAPKHFVFTNRTRFPRLRFPLCSLEVVEQQRQLKDYLSELNKSAAVQKAKQSEIWPKATHLKTLTSDQEANTETCIFAASQNKHQQPQEILVEKQRGGSLARSHTGCEAEEQPEHATMMESTANSFQLDPFLHTDNKLSSEHNTNLQAKADHGALEEQNDENTRPGASGDTARTVSSHATIPTVTQASNDDLVRIRAKYHRRNVGICEPPDNMSSLLYPHRKVSTTSPNSAPDDTIVSSATTTVCTPNHPSKSTIENILYGAGSGPACRPSKWEFDRREQDAARAATEAEQLDAIAFFEEGLESPNRSSSSCEVPAFTKQFPRFDRLTLTNPFESLGSSVDVGMAPDSHVNSDAPQTDLDVIPLHVLLHKVVLAPLTCYMRQLDLALCDHFLYNLNLLVHFHRLRQIYFLQHGEFAQMLLYELFEKVSDLSSDLDEFRVVGFLHDLMQSVAQKFHPSATPSVQKQTTALQLFEGNLPLVIDVPIDLILSEETIPIRNHSTVRNIPGVLLFDRICISYEAPWPLNIPIHDRIVSKYNVIFRQLVRIKFASWTLHRSYRQLRLLDSFHSDSSRLHLTHLWLFEMQQVVCGLEAYLTNQAVNTSWTRFVRPLLKSTGSSDSDSLRGNRVENLDQLISAHDAYLQELMRCCLADPADKELQQVLHGLLSCVHWFHKVLSAGRWIDSAASSTHVDHSGWQQLHAAHQSFRQHARFLRRRAGSLVSANRFSSIRSVLMQLILCLGTNDFYANPTALSSESDQMIG